RVNLSRFGRKKSRGDSTQDRSCDGHVKRGVAPALEREGARVDKPFKNALLGESSGHQSHPVISVDADVDPDFMQILEGSYVGRLAKG
ncbi:hypothetical protein A2U01_0084425, partial [Trifolium medium]|nr:hypothetical protein [Trifolium medium]